MASIILLEVVDGSRHGARAWGLVYVPILYLQVVLGSGYEVAEYCVVIMIVKVRLALYIYRFILVEIIVVVGNIGNIIKVKHGAFHPIVVVF